MRNKAPAIRHRQSGTAIRKGFTLVEMLTVIAIAGLLLSLILPAVMDARGAARRLSCANNEHQIGTALAEFESTHGHFPPSFAGANPSTSVPRLLWSYSPSSWLAAELSGPSLAAKVPTLQVNPFWDPDWNGIDLPSPTALRCPDDSYTVDRASNYRYCRGVLPLWPKDPGGVFIHFHAIRTAEITDGLSTTAFASERPVSMPIPGSPDRRRDLMVFDHLNTPDIASTCISANRGNTADAWWWNTEPAGNVWFSGALDPQRLLPSLSTQQRLGGLPQG